MMVPMPGDMGEPAHAERALPFSLPKIPGKIDGPAK